MSSSLLRYAAVAALFSSSAHAAGRSTYGSMPSQTVGQGVPILEAMATEAPSLELVKKQLDRLEKRQSLVNVCSEWTILGGNGRPQCSNSQTCLFSSVSGTYYEGCGQESIRYDWITECSPYPNTGTAGVSQVFCNSAFPSCGTFEFIFREGATFSNYGCSDSAYSYKATLLPTTGSVNLAAGSSSIELEATAYITVTSIPTDRISSNEIPGQEATSSPTGDSNPSRKKSTPIGAIVGGVIGGVAVIALIGFIAWFCLRKRKQDKENAALQAQSATAQAYQNNMPGHNNGIPEADGTNIAKPGAGAFAPVNHNYTPPSEKPIAGVAANEYRPQPQTQHSSGYGNEIDPRSANASPPPMYPAHNVNNNYAQPSTSPQTQLSSPASHYTELDPSSATNATRHSSIPISPAGTNNGTFISNSNVSELGGGENRMSYQAYHPPASPPPIPEMASGASGAGNASSGGINRRPVNSAPRPDVDMSGAPMSENYRPHEMP